MSAVLEVADGRASPASKTLPLGSTAMSCAVTSLPATATRATPWVPKEEATPEGVTLITVSTSRPPLLDRAVTNAELASATATPVTRAEPPTFTLTRPLDPQVLSRTPFGVKRSTVIRPSALPPPATRTLPSGASAVAAVRPGARLFV